MDKKLKSIGNLEEIEHARLKKFCDRNDLSVVLFIKDSITYFEKSGANPKTIETPTVQFSKMRERLDQVIRFMKTEEKGFLNDTIDKILALDIKLTSELNNITTKADVKELANSYSDLVDELKKVLANIKAENARQMETIKASHLSEIASLNARHDREMSNLKTLLANERKATTEEIIQQHANTIEVFKSSIHTLNNWVAGLGGGLILVSLFTFLYLIFKK